MPSPQQPELRRSERTPAQDPDSVASDLEAHRRPGDSGRTGPVPEENRPGHHPEVEQDQPADPARASRTRDRTAGERDPREPDG